MTDPKTVYALFECGAIIVTFHSLLDGAVVAEVSLGHALIGGTSSDDMIATIGLNPYSVIIINDRHEREQQLIKLPGKPKVIAISPAHDTVAVMLKSLD